MSRLTEANQQLWRGACRLAAKTTGADYATVLEAPGKVGRGGDAATTEARKLACWVAMQLTLGSGRELARATGLHHSTVEKHCREVAAREAWRRLAWVAA